jgi:hypothetical protein
MHSARRISFANMADSSSRFGLDWGSVEVGVVPSLSTDDLPLTYYAISK